MRQRIHVPLLERPSVLCEADAKPAGDGRFRLAGAGLNRERLLFKRGEIIECEIQLLPNGLKGLVAVRAATADTEFTKRRTVYAICGAIVGAVLGAGSALWVDMSIESAAIGATVGGVAFGFCSARWGDSAWEALIKAMHWPR